MRKCTMCGEEKDNDCFYKNKSRKDGLYYQCKQCFSCYRKERYLSNSGNVREKNRQYYNKNRNTIIEKNREWRCKNRKKVLESDRARYIMNIDEVRKKSRERAINNKEQYSAQRRLRRFLKENEIAIPRYCQKCKKECRPDAHHFNGYEKWMDVVFLCRSCHKKTHSNENL